MTTQGITLTTAYIDAMEPAQVDWCLGCLGGKIVDSTDAAIDWRQFPEWWPNVWTPTRRLRDVLFPNTPRPWPPVVCVSVGDVDEIRKAAGIAPPLLDFTDPYLYARWVLKRHAGLVTS